MGQGRAVRFVVVEVEIVYFDFLVLVTSVDGCCWVWRKEQNNVDTDKTNKLLLKPKMTGCGLLGCRSRGGSSRHVEPIEWTT